MSNPESQVVIAYDFSHTGHEALARGAAVAARASFHVLHVVCVIEPHQPIAAVPAEGGVDYRYADRVQEALRERVAQELRAASAPDQTQFFLHVRIGKPAVEILDVARDVGADLILIGTKGLTGVERIVLGSVAERVVREAGCTVEVVRAKTYKQVTRLAITDAPEHPHGHRRAHHYSYDSSQVLKRPNDFPIY